MDIRTIDERFAVTGQIRPADIEALAAGGYVAVICTRPDNEEPAQPVFAEIASEAQKRGMKAFHFPMSGGNPSADQIASFADAMAQCDGPVLGYCRSGARAASLYSSIRR